MERAVGVELLHGGECLLSLVPISAWYPLLGGFSAPAASIAYTALATFTVSRELGCDELRFHGLVMALALVSLTSVVDAIAAAS
jgi:hypothetical protein